jgi:hypothetical protein
MAAVANEVLEEIARQKACLNASHRRFLQLVFNGLNQHVVFRSNIGGETGDNLAITTDKKLLEVPEDIVRTLENLAHFRQLVEQRVIAVAVRFGDSIGQRVVELVLIVANDGDFRHDRESDVEVGRAEVLDFRIRPRFLPEEVVGREADDLQSQILILQIELFQPFILLRQPAFRSHVDHKQQLAIIVRKGGFSAIRFFKGISVTLVAMIWFLFVVNLTILRSLGQCTEEGKAVQSGTRVD